MEIEVIGDSRGLAAVSREWRQLDHARQSPLLDYPWMLAAATCLHRDQLHVIVVRRSGALVAVAPLALSRSFGIQRAYLMGVAALSEPASLLFQDAVAAALLVKTLATLGKPVVLQRVALDDAAITAFIDSAQPNGRLFRRAASAAPYVDIASDWDTYTAGLSSRRRYDYRRNRKRLQSQGEVQVTHLSPTPEVVATVFARFVAVEAAGWKSTSGSSLRVKPALLSFFAAATKQWSQEGSLRLSFLALNGQDLAAVLWLVQGNRAWVLKIGYDERWSEASPGIQLLWEVLQTAFEQRLASFEFLGGDEPWLSIWTVTKRRYETVVFYPRTAVGMAALAADALSSLARKAVQRLRRK